MSWKTKSPRKITFDGAMEGQELIGKLDAVGQAGSLDVHSYTMTTEDGEIVSFLGNTVLDQVLGDEEGSLVKIKYLGTAKSRAGFDVKQFEVAVHDDDGQEDAEVEIE